MTATVVVSELRKSYEMGRLKVHALDGIDLAVDENAFLTFMGPSGSGKSTLLYMLGGLDRPSSGRIAVNGASLEAMDENGLAGYRRRQVGFIFQSFNLIPSLPALENVAYPMRFAGVPRRRRLAIASELLHKVGLGNRLQHKPHELSGGQQQRVAIARALVNDPRLILADEPTGNLDSGSGQAIMQLLAELHQNGRTICVVSHDPRMAAFATDTLYMMDGRIVSHEAYEAAIAVTYSGTSVH